MYHTGMICRQCKEDKDEEQFYRPRKDKVCKRCHCINMREKRKKNRPKYNALRAASRARRPWWVRYLNDVVRWTRDRSAKNGIEWGLNRDFVKGLWEMQEGKCALSGFPFSPVQERGKATTFSPSIDRIDPGGGYVPGNVRFILHGLNSLKGREDDEAVFAVCRAVAERAGNV